MIIQLAILLAHNRFPLIFDIQPKFVNNKLHTLSMLIEPLYDDTILVQTSNIILLKNHISKILGSQPPLNSLIVKSNLLFWERSCDY